MITLNESEKALLKKAEEQYAVTCEGWAADLQENFYEVSASELKTMKFVTNRMRHMGGPDNTYDLYLEMAAKARELVTKIEECGTDEYVPIDLDVMTFSSHLSTLAMDTFSSAEQELFENLRHRIERETLSW